MHTLALQTQNSEGYSLTKGTLGPNPVWLASSRLYRVETSGPVSSERERQARDWMAMLEVCCIHAGPLTDSVAQCPLVGLQALQISEARLRSPQLGSFPQGKEEKALKGPFTTHYELHCSLGHDLLKPAEQRD